ncbi:MAG TPA: SCO family protein, partial [Acetobacteraceae bacterium]
RYQIMAGGAMNEIVRALAALLLALLPTACSAPADAPARPPLQGARIGGPFTLVDQDGRTVTDRSFAGKYRIVYFGYTFCPDVCPTELQTMTSALDLLGPLAEKVAPLFITVDPERDTVPVMADYVKLFGPRLVGLTGSPAQVAAAARAYRVYFAKSTPKETSEYLMDHSSFLYLMGPDGRFRALFRQGTSAQELADSIRARLSAAS